MPVYAYGHAPARGQVPAGLVTYDRSMVRTQPPIAMVRPQLQVTAYRGNQFAAAFMLKDSSRSIPARMSINQQIPTSMQPQPRHRPVIATPMKQATAMLVRRATPRVKQMYSAGSRAPGIKYIPVGGRMLVAKPC